jgi:hypothetical protein
MPATASGKKVWPLFGLGNKSFCSRFSSSGILFGSGSTPPPEFCWKAAQKKVVLRSTAGDKLAAQATFETESHPEKRPQGGHIPCHHACCQLPGVQAAEGKAADLVKNFSGKSAAPEFRISDHQADVSDACPGALRIKKLDFSRTKKNLGLAIHHGKKMTARSPT